MADFCFQCNVDLIFGPYTDFGPYPANAIRAVLCEGCGPIRVDSRGWCVDPRCPVHAVASPVGPDRYGSAARWAARRVGAMGWAYRLLDRLRGTPWEPGWVHLIRWKYYDWKDKRSRPECYGSDPGPQQQSENGCGECRHHTGCHEESKFVFRDL